MPEPHDPPRLGRGRKAIYALGDVTVNGALSSLSIIYASFFLTQVAGLRPALAGLVPLVGRVVDAFSDPLMGRLSDRTTWRSGRRRPYFLIGAIPFGICFALVWSISPAEGQGARFAWYAGTYCLLALSMTVVSVPYLAIQPEMAVDYDERTSLNTWRTMGSILGVFAAVLIRPVADAFGGGPAGFATAGWIFGVLVALPWIAVHRATFERRAYQARPAQSSLLESLRDVAGHRSFVRLCGIYIMGRIAMDLAATLMILYVSFWLGRSDDFEPLMATFLGCVVLALPMWLRLAVGRDKVRIFLLGSTWWMFSSLTLAFVEPDWPRWIMFAFVAFLGVGYAVVDVMPWSMLGEVIDQDDLETGERREGLYNGLFMFLRKLGGALGVFLAMTILDVAGLTNAEVQGETTRRAILWLTSLGPAVCLAVGIALARGYPLTRDVHADIVRQLAERQQQAR